MNINFKYLVLPLSIIVCISGNYSNAMEVEDEINTSNNIINTNSNIINDDSYQHIFDENYNKEYYDDVCNKCIEYITKHKPQYKTFIESSSTVFNKLIEIAHAGHLIDSAQYMQQIAQPSDNFRFNNNGLLDILNVHENKLLNNNTQQLNQYIAQNNEHMFKPMYYIKNLLSKLKAQCIVKLTDSINNGENYTKQIDIIKDSQKIIDSIITIMIQNDIYLHNCGEFPDNFYYKLKNEVDLLDKIYYKGSKLENRFNNLHNKIISTFEDMINNHNSSNIFVTINKLTLKFINQIHNQNDKLFKFLQTDKEKFIEFNKIISTLQNTSKFTTKQYYKYIIDMLTILKNITDNQIQNRLNNNFTQVIFNNSEEYEDIITYYLSIAYLLLECENNEDINNTKSKYTLIDVILRFTRYYQIDFGFKTRYYKIKDTFAKYNQPVNEYFCVNKCFYEHAHGHKPKDHIAKLLQNRRIQILDTSEGNLNNMQWYEQLLYNMVYTLVVLQYNENLEFDMSDDSDVDDNPDVNDNMDIDNIIDQRDFAPILRQFICIMSNNIYGRDFSCEAAFILYYKTMVNKLDKIIKKSIFDGLVKLNSNKYNNQDTYNRVQNIDIIRRCNIINAFREEYEIARNSIWYDTAMKLFSSYENFLAASNIETIVNNVKNNTTLGNNQNNTTQNTFDNLFLFIIMIYNDNIINEQDLTELLDVLIDMIKNNTTFPHSVNNITQINLDGFINNVGKTENKQVLHSLLYLSLYSLIAWYQDVLSNNNDNENTKSNKITTFINNYILGGKDKNKETNLQQKNYNGYMKIINAILKQLINIKCKNIFEKYKNKDFAHINQHKIEGDEKALYTDCVRGVYDLFSFVNIASHKILYKKYGVKENNQNNKLTYMSNNNLKDARSDLLIRFYNTFKIGKKFIESFKNVSKEHEKNNCSELIDSIINFFNPNDTQTFVNFIFGSHKKNEDRYKQENVRNNMVKLPANPHNEIAKFL